MMEYNVEEVRELVKKSAEKYDELLHCISQALQDDEKFDLDTMDPFEYLTEQAPELAKELTERFVLMISYNEMLNEMEANFDD